jgi:hypothetical protein
MLGFRSLDRRWGESQFSTFSTEINFVSLAERIGNSSTMDSVESVKNRRQTRLSRPEKMSVAVRRITKGPTIKSSKFLRLAAFKRTWWRAAIPPPICCGQMFFALY